MHGRLHHPTDTQRRDRQHWWCLIWRLAAVLALGLALTSPSPVQAKTFHCGVGDVPCLIDAIHEANANGKKNTIRLAAGTYTLTAVDNTTDGPNGLPSVTSEFLLTIRGAKDEATIIERQFGAPSFRLVHVAATGILALERLTLQRGSTSGPPSGGGIFNNGTLTLTHSTISGNSVSGIFNDGTLTLTHSTVSRNFAGTSGGGGIRNDGTLTLTHSTVSDNNAGSPGFAPGGGIYNTGTLTVTNSTLSGNSAGSGGGRVGGGIFTRSDLGGVTTLQNTIVALNTEFFAPIAPDCNGPVTSQGNNLVGDPTGCRITLQATDLTGDPGLDDFTDDGTPGNGHFPLLPTSQAIDAGNDAACPRRDQLGQRRVNIPGVGTSRCDIGAIEFQRRDKHQDDADPATAAHTTP